MSSIEDIQEHKIKQLQDIHRQLLLAMGAINEIEKTISRLRSEALEIDPHILNGKID
jgi:hypothetical protein